MRDVGNVWCCPKGVEKNLSQFMMALNIHWDIEFSTKTFKKTGHIEDSCFSFVIEEVFRCIFTQKRKGLNVHALDDNTCGNVFGS